MPLRTCQKCNEVKDLESEFYRHHGVVFHSVCKACRRVQSSELSRRRLRRPPKPTGFARLPVDRQRILQDAVQAGKSIRQIANECDVKYSTLSAWLRAGTIPPVLTRQIAVDPRFEYELNRLRTI
jgi:hypothetical protein